MTPTGKAMIGSTPFWPSQGAKPQAAAIMQRFNKMGVAAGTAKRLQVFKMPADKATKDMKAM